MIAEKPALRSLAKPPPIGWVAAVLLLACATTGAVIPSLRPLVRDTFGLGAWAAGLFVAMHVLGTIIGARLWGVALHRDGSLALRRLLAGSLLGSATLHGVMSLVPAFGVLLALRLAEGVLHVGAVMLLMGLGTRGQQAGRARDAALLGTCLVLGVALGMATGGVIAGFGAPHAFVAAAVIGVAAALLAGKLPARFVLTTEKQTQAAQTPRVWMVPPAIVLAERFAIGALTVWVPYRLAPGASGILLGALMTSSVLGMPLARAVAGRLGATRTTLAGACAFALALASGLEVNGPSPAGFAWALTGGLGAGMLFAGALMLVAGEDDPRARTRGMGLVHAFGSVGFLFGSLTGSAAATWTLPPGLLGASLLGASVFPLLAISRRRREAGAGAAASPAAKV